MNLQIVNNGQHEGLRLSFADAVFEAKAFQGEGKADYNCAFLISPDTPAGQTLIDEINAGCEKVAREKWGTKADAIILSMKENDRLAIHNGNKKAEYDGYPGNFFINARSKTRPLVIDRDRTPLTAADGRIYSGCYVNPQIILWAQDNSFGKRINAELKGIQFVRDGDAFGGAGPAASADDFGDLSVGGSGDDLV